MPCQDHLSFAVARLIVSRLLAADAAIEVVVVYDPDHHQTVRHCTVGHATITRYGRSETVEIADTPSIWHSAFGNTAGRPGLPSPPTNNCSASARPATACNAPCR